MCLDDKKKLTGIANSLNLTIEQLDGLDRYAALLVAWNKRTNLISAGDMGRIYEKHICESLWFCHPDILGESSTAMDLGSGGGLPGFPMKIARPNLLMVLLEARRNKALFLREAAERLHLDGVQVVCERAENLLRAEERCWPVDLIVSRAVATLARLWKWGAPLLSAGGRVIALKGGDLRPEIEELEEKRACEVQVVSIDALFPRPQAKDKSLIIMMAKTA